LVQRFSGLMAASSLGGRLVVVARKWGNQNAVKGDKVRVSQRINKRTWTMVACVHTHVADLSKPASVTVNYVFIKVPIHPFA